MSNEDVPETPTAMIERRLREMKVVLDPEIHYQLDKVFPKLTGWGSNGDIKRRGKMIRLVEPALKRLLLEGEQVLYVAKGVQYSFLEHYFMGFWAALLNQTVFVLTNARLLMMRSDSNGKPSEMFWMIYYSEIANFKTSWSGVLNLKLRDQSKPRFTGFSSLDRKSMPIIFRESMEDYQRLNFSPTTTQSRENLCCHCFQVVPKGDWTCGNCGTEYWKPSQLALRSLIFPSWGDICMKHYVFAFFEVIGYMASWAVAVAHFANGDEQTGFMVLGFIFLIEHTVDSMLTFGLASKGLNHRRNPDPNRHFLAPGEHQPMRADT